MSALVELPALRLPGHEPTTRGNDDHPMRVMTKRAAGLADPPWDAEAVRQVTELFDRLAPEWHTRTSAERRAVVADALDRGLAACGGPTRLVVEVGSGIGAYSSMLAERFDRAVACELSTEMLARAPVDPAARVQADARRLPLADGVASAVVLVNMFLFPAEVDRVLAADGVLVWVNSSGEDTPIHLMPDEVATALPGEWNGVQSRAGAGLWAAMQRARTP